MFGSVMDCDALVLVRRNLKGLTPGDKRQAMEALQVKVWIDGNTIEAEGSIPLPNVSIASRSLTWPGHNTHQRVPFVVAL